MENYSYFWSPDYLDVSAWTEHIPFAFWIIEILKPKIVVELGVHNGTSYFAFCQAVKQLNLNAHCYGIDSWQGDDHAGFYNDQIFGKVAAYNTSQYSRFSTLIKSTFDEAKEYFIDGTIQILHIDGLHTYEAVKHDFETWLPKLAPDAIVIFHDTNIRERNFGVFKFWEELKEQYKHFQFDFGHGLGVLAIGEVADMHLKSLFQNNNSNTTYYNFLRNLFSERGRFFKTQFEFEQKLQCQIEIADVQKTVYTQLTETYKAAELKSIQTEQKVRLLTENNLKLTQKIAGLEAHYVAAAAAAAQQLEADKLQIMEKATALKLQVITTEEANKQLTHNIEALQSTLTGIEIQVIKSEEAHNVLLGNHEQLKENFTRIELHNRTMEEEMERLTESNKKLQEQNNQLEAKFNSLTESYKAILLKNEKLNENHKLSNLKTLELRNQYHTDTDDLTRELRSVSASMAVVNNQLNAQEATIKNLNEKIEQLEQTIQWYKATFEERSLLGTVKEKITSAYKNKAQTEQLTEQKLLLKQDHVSELLNGSKINPLSNKTDQPRLIPVHHIIFHPEHDEYVTTGTDPYFFIETKAKLFKAGWYWLSVDVSVLVGSLSAPRLYYNFGKGFNEEDSWKLPSVKDDKLESLVKLPFDVIELRLDPTVTECTFKITGFQLKYINKLKAFQIAISNYKHNEASKGGYKEALNALATSYLKGGTLELKKTLKNSITIKEEKKAGGYAEWCTLYDTVTEKHIEQIKILAAGLSYKPLFSIIMPVYNAPVLFLQKAIESVRNQAYGNWELCIADDRSTDKKVKKLLIKYQQKDDRIKVAFRNENGHISKASNTALELATGDYIVLLDQDDELRPHSLYMAAKAINNNNKLALIYSDEDKIDEKGARFDPYFKTDWNKDLFYGHNMVSHLGIYKHSLIKRIKGFRVGFEGSQDYDLALRCIEHITKDQICHIPHVLYHWRAIKGSTATTASNKSYAHDAGLKALKDHLKRTKQQATVHANLNSNYQIKWPLTQQPKVSIVIPTKDKVEVLATCINSILLKTTYKNFEVLIIDNNSVEEATFQFYKNVQVESKQVKVHNYNSEFNFSAVVNYGVKQSTGTVLLLLNNDTEVINEDWLHEMVSHCIRPEIGAVGAKLYYPNGQIQHAGVFLAGNHPGIHIYLKREKEDTGYFNKLNLVQNYSAVTAACLAVRKELYLKVGGLDEKNLKVSYNDVDFCLKLREAGYRNLWTPFAKMIHYESLSRGSDLTEENLPRFQQEQSFMRDKWKDALIYDPYFNPNLYYHTTSTQYAFPPVIPYEWEEITMP